MQTWITEAHTPSECQASCLSKMICGAVSTNAPLVQNAQKAKHACNDSSTLKVIDNLYTDFQPFNHFYSDYVNRISKTEFLEASESSPTLLCKCGSSGHWEMQGTWKWSVSYLLVIGIKYLTKISLRGVGMEWVYFPL